MAYDIPEYVDTPEQAILAVASAVKGEQVAGGDGSVNTALDILADVLAGEDIEVPQTDAGAILALAQYVSGGGGGPELGALGQCYYDTVEPTVGGEIEYLSVINSVYLGEQLVASATPAMPDLYLALAAGLVVETVHHTGGTVCTAYVCTLDEDSGLYTAVEPWDGPFTAHADGDNTYWTFTMPALNEGEWLVLWPH